MTRRTVCLTACLFAAISASLHAEDGIPEPQELFQQLDKDKNGQLEAGEIPDAQQRFFARLLRTADKNEDGALSEEEFIAGHEADDGPGLPLNALGGGGGRGLGDPKQRFQMLDRNKDGKVSRDEVPEFAKERLGRLFDRFGKDELTLEDFQKAEQFAPGANRPDAEQLFTRLDTNKDGKLSAEDKPAGEARNQLRQILRRSGKDPQTGITKADFLANQPKPAMEEKDKASDDKNPASPEGGPLFRRLDKNRDGKLSQDELPPRLKTNFKRLDADGNGYLTPDEMPFRPQAASNKSDGKSRSKRPESE